MGHPRPLPQGKLRPLPNKYGWIPILPKDGLYTTKPLPIQKLGGRDPETGRVVVRTIGGGNKKNYRWIDLKRHAPEGETVEEKVYIVRYDPLRSPLIAMVANGGHKRWIIASENMKPGDIVKTTNIIPRKPIRVEEGDTWPLGAIPPGTLIHCVEQIVGEGAHYALVAGSSCEVMRRMGKMIVVKLHLKNEVALDERCMATVGRCSNTEHNTINLLIPQRMRWKGKRMNSGLWHRKDGYCGRKIKPMKPLQIFDSEQINVKNKFIMQPIHLL
ncbi:39S ribosomal protein L2, mitochondrial [Halotydeus destructor]|nr:39S ribosomal protein L2, mitochondrial [Halotydeus destructor]